MAILGVDGGSTVVGISIISRWSRESLHLRLFRVLGTGKDGDICAGHAEQSVICDTGNRSIDERRGGTVRVEVDDVHPLFGVSVRVH